MILIVVESPTKAKAINEYLKTAQEKYKVLSTYGHIRNLITKSGSIETANDYKYHWKTTAQWEKNKKELLIAAKEAGKIIIATDLDREGEGIAWHLLEIFKENKINNPTERIVFHSVEKSAILEALKHGQNLRLGLVESYLARIGLDYLFGFSISPLLWRKVPCCKSAGRVQSVALRLIVEREAEIKDFKSVQYLTIHAKFHEVDPISTLIELDGQKFENGNIFNQEINIEDLRGTFITGPIKTQESKQFAPAPFITSTLLQAASSKLNFSPAMTMQLAQKLYEGFKINGKHVGLITYMRTDSPNIEPSAINKIRDIIKDNFSAQYLPSKPNSYKSTTKNAQEAHEAIRPVDFTINPDNLDIGDKNLEKLYKLIWKRTIASQMTSAIFETKTIDINGTSNKHKSIFELKTTKILFPGFKAIFNENDEEELENADLSNIKENQELQLEDLFAKEHQTQPPRRFSEATLIQQLEKRGIGRPSTYPKIIQVLYDREYTTKEKKIIIPTQRGWLVTAFLKGFFPEEVAYEFTANLEEDLDNLIQTNSNHTQILEKFWHHLEKYIKNVEDKAPSIISSKIQDEFSNYFLKNVEKCKNCGGHMILKIGKFGAILGCENYPNCKEIINIDQSAVAAPVALHIDNKDITIKSGQFGPYIEFMGENNVIKRISIPKIWQNNENELTNEQIAFLSSLPKDIGEYNEEKVSVSIGRFGPFIKYGSLFVSIKDPMKIDIEQAGTFIERKIKKNEQIAKGEIKKREIKKTWPASKTKKK